MYAVVEIGGEQFKVTQGDEILAPKLPGQMGEKLTFDRVLMVVDGEAVKIGQPALSGARIEAAILTSEQRAPKVIVFKKKRRKGYRRTRGHRQSHSRIRIEQITV